LPGPQGHDVHPTPRALITGASSGIGREFARVAAGDGYDLVIVARRAERLQALAAELGGTGVEVTPVVADLAGPAGVPAVVSAVGGRPVDVLVNDAGVGGVHSRGPVRTPGPLRLFPGLSGGCSGG
jgi:short-subunit dehydrogenase